VPTFIFLCLWMMLGCCLHLCSIFLLMFTLWCRLADIDATFSSLVSLLQAINYQWCHCYCYHGVDENPGQGCKTGVNDTSDNLSPVSLTPVKSLSPVSLTPANTKLRISLNFCKNSKWP